MAMETDTEMGMDMDMGRGMGMDMRTGMDKDMRTGMGRDTGTDIYMTVTCPGMKENFLYIGFRTAPISD
jgi:hypothetical protein